VIKPVYHKTFHKFPISSEDGTAPQMIELFSDPNGFQHLQCLCGVFMMKQWCLHMTLLYQKELDAGHIASTTGVHIFKPPHSLVVPVLVLQQKIIDGSWVVPQLGGGGADDRLSEVKAVFGKIKAKPQMGQLEADGVYPLGYILRGVHGRRTLRKLLFEWLVAVPTLYPEHMVCTASCHSKGDSFFDTIRPTDAQESWKVRDAFTLLDTGKCYSCLEVTTVPADLPS